MITVIDSSVVLAVLTADGSIGSWASEQLAGGELVAPHLLPAEVANGLRRAAASDRVSEDAASIGRDEFARLPVELFPFEIVSARVWELRHNVTPYDAWYVALAELLDAPLATADRRLAAAPGPRCTFLTPPA